MTLSPPDPVTVARTSATLGGGVWAITLALPFGTVDRLILLAAFVHVPLAVSLIPRSTDPGEYGRFYRSAAYCQPIGALGILGAAIVGEGLLAAALLSPWLATIGLLALFGIDRFRRRGPFPLAETLIDAGTVYAIVGAGSYLFHVLGIDFGFPSAIVHLTAAHFHYAGLLLPVVAGLAGRVVADGTPRQVYHVGAVTVLGGMPLVAAGITLSRLADLRIAEFAGASLFAAGVFVLAVVLLAVAAVPTRVANRPIDGISRALLAIAGCSVAVTMLFAAGYGYARAFDPSLLTISTMIRYHGITNAVGFALPGLLAWHVARPLAAAPDGSG